MEPFLKTIAKHYYKAYGNKINTCCFVFPNRRASLFFKKHLGEACTTPIFAPDTLAINELFAQLTPLKEADTLGLIFSLYEKHKQLSSSEESFDEFYSWGETLLGDFDDIDKYQVDAEQLFSNIYELKSIDDTFSYLSEEQIAAIKHFWRDFKDYSESGSRRSFLQSWLILAPLYKSFRESLEKEGLGYEGMMYRDVAEMAKNKCLPELPYTRYVFIGLNALNGCEKALMKHYQKLDMADFHWDFQSDFLKDPQNKAGFFIRRNIIDFPQHPQLDFEPITLPEFESIAIPSNTGQTKIISTLLESKNISKTEDLENTAIVLSDEQLMIPMLHALPQDIKAYNITMGYPLKATGIYTFFSQLLILQKNVKYSNGECTFYFKNVISILRHSFIAKHFAKDCDEIVETLTANNLINANVDILGKNHLFKHIFKAINRANDFPLYLKQIFGTCMELYKEDEEDEDEISLNTNDDKLEKEFLYHLYINISRFCDLIEQYNIDVGIDIVSRLLRKHIDTIAIPFYGEPLKGLQVMGILETRILDFENIIYLSFNEGIFPKAAPINSFIPHNLRYGFGLPTLEFQDAIFAHHFYRIIQRAKHVWMVYDSSSGGMKRGEVSRYFSQLKYVYNQKISERVQTYDIELTTPKPIIIEKSKAIMAKLNRYTEKDGSALSASALNNYIDCPLKFYFQKVEHLREEDELQEEIDNSTFGTIFHYVIEHLYEPYEDATITSELLTALSKDDKKIEQQIEIAFAVEHFKTEKIKPLKGRHLIISRVIKKYVKQLLKQDMSICPFIYRKGEQKIEAYFKFDGDTGVNFTGFIDRLDEVNGQLRVIDYKTGLGKKMSFKDMEQLTTDSKKRPAPIFQTFFYAWIIHQTTPNKNLLPSVYYIRNLFKDFDPNIYHNKDVVDDYSLHHDDFEKVLVATLKEIFNPKIAFTQTEEQDKCRYCTFKDICLK